ADAGRTWSSCEIDDRRAGVLARRRETHVADRDHAALRIAPVLRDFETAAKGLHGLATVRREDKRLLARQSGRTGRGWRGASDDEGDGADGRLGEHGASPCLRAEPAPHTLTQRTRAFTAGSANGARNACEHSTFLRTAASDRRMASSVAAQAR